MMATLRLPPALCFLLLIPLLVAAPPMQGQTRDTIKADDGAYTQANPVRTAWEESVILSPKAPCRIVAVQIYYATAGSDTVRITGDAAEATIPPTQYCFAYNTLGYAVHTVSAPGWKTINLAEKNIQLGGADRVVVQHVLNTGVAVWGQDAAQNPVTSYVYDALTPNPNFYNIPGIFYRASGDYLVRLIVDYPTEVQPPPTWTDVTDLQGIVDQQGARLKSDLATVADIDGDGWDDLIIGSVAYKNDHGQSFTRFPLNIAASNTVWADVDNDGDLDCFAVRANGNGTLDGLYENDGTGVLTDRSATAGIDNDAPTVTPLFFDYDHDGDVDLFIANGRRTVNNQEVYYQDRLYRNNGNWTFTNVTSNSAIAAAEQAPYFDTWGASIADVNMDGWTDIFVATYRLAPDLLYINNGDGTFTESARSTGAIGIPTAEASYFGHGMGSDWADINNDGLLDLAVGNLGHPDQRGQYSNPSLILMNTGSASAPSYTNWHSMSATGTLAWHGVAFREMNAGMCFADFDHDGSQDLYHGQISYDQYGAGATRPAHFYLQGADHFVDMTWQTGLFIHGSWTGVRLDFDRDGDMDLLAASGRHEVRLFRNDLQKRGSSVTVRLEHQGVATMPRDAYGSTVRVYAGGKTYLRQAPGTIIGGRCSQMSHDLHVGIGDASEVDSIVVTWATGTTTAFTNVPLNTHTILNSNGGMRSIGLGTPQLILPAQHSINTPVRPTLLAAGSLIEMQISPQIDFSSNVISLQQQSGGVVVPEDLINGTTYYWRARYERGPAVGPWSGTWQFTVGSPAPSAPVVTSPLAATTNNALQLTTRWTPATMASWQQFPIAYQIEIVDQTDGQPACVERGIVDTMFTCTLNAQTAYEVRVRGVSQDVAGPWSASVPFSTYGVPDDLQLTAPVDQARDQPVRPRLQWEEHEWVDDGYIVEYGLADDFSDAVSKERPTNEYRIISQLLTGRTYYWHVRGKNQAGMGPWSPTWSFSVEGTVGVAEHGQPAPSIDRVMVYDLLGRMVFSGTYSDWQQRSFPYFHVAVGYTRSGTVHTLP